MRKVFLASLALAAMTFLFSGCNQFKKMQKNVETIEVKSNPEILFLAGNTVDADVTIAFAPNYFGKKIVLKVTPVLKFDGGEITGTAKYFQGEKVKQNYTSVPYKAGGSYTFPVSFPYDPRAALSTLELRIEGCSDNQSVYASLTTIPAAQGVSMAQALAQPYITVMPHGFQKVTTITEEANIHYVVNSHVVRNSELTKEQIKLFENFIKENQNKENVALGSIRAKSFASPEGPEKFNERLSADRSNSGQKAFLKQLKGTNVEYDGVASGEDWEGFRKLVEASDIADKDLILQVLSMYDSSAQRDQEIRNLSMVYTELKQNILPKLRRTQFVISADITGKSDDELVYGIRHNDRDLTAEEMLYAATLVNGEERIAAYRLAAVQHNDIRAYNNLAVALFENGELKGAKAAMTDAAKVDANNKCVINNLAALTISEGNYAAAKQSLAKTNCDNASKNKALLAMYEKDYATAAKGLEGHNLAVCEVLRGNYPAAKNALDNANGAASQYLGAIIAMRSGESRAAISHLRNAIAKEPKLREKARKDIEFARLFGTDEFNAL